MRKLVAIVHQAKQGWVGSYRSACVVVCWVWVVAGQVRLQKTGEWMNRQVNR
jgi:hypothetical protein